DHELTSHHPIGHVNFDLECEPSSFVPEGAKIITGQTSVGNESEEMILKKGYGLGAALTPSSGRWETEDEVLNDLEIRQKRGTISSIEYSISSKTCARALDYLSEYKQKNYDQIYGGLQSRPRYGEGGGCSA